MCIDPLNFIRANDLDRPRALIRQHPEDFFVEEVLGFEPDGEGEHLFLQLEKRGCNTAWVVEQYAKQLGCRISEIGYSGLKDRHALTRQWLSLPVPIKSPWQWQPIDGVQVLQARRHGKKLRVGAHRGNRFRLTLRHCVVGDRRALERQLEALQQGCVPNYFGPQRFGHQGRNWSSASAWLLQQPRPKCRPAQRGLWFSVLRAGVFNALLAEQVAQGRWQQLHSGDIAALAGSGSVFVVEHDSVPALSERLASNAIHPTGPLVGAAPSDPRFALAWQSELERLPAAWPIIEQLALAGLTHQRRALRLQPQQLDWQWLEPDTLQLSFELVRGGFATSVLNELFDYHEAER